MVNLVIWGEDENGFWKANWNEISVETANGILESYIGKPFVEDYDMYEVA